MASYRTRSVIRKDLEDVRKRIDDDEKFRNLMTAKDLHIDEIVGDGACLFRAWAKQVLGDESRHQEVREASVAEMERNKDYYIPFLIDDRTGLQPTDFSSYMQYKLRPGTFGDHLDITALTNVYNRSVWIYKFQNGHPLQPTKIDPNNVPKTNPVLLSYHMNNHYNSVRCKDHQKVTGFSTSGVQDQELNSQGSSFTEAMKENSIVEDVDSNCSNLNSISILVDHSHREKFVEDEVPSNHVNEGRNDMQCLPSIESCTPIHTFEVTNSEAPEPFLESTMTKPTKSILCLDNEESSSILDTSGQPIPVFMCRKCKKEFVTSKVLQLHENIHTEKYYKCFFTDCHYAFFNLSILKIHLYGVHTATAMTCPECEFTTNSTKNFRSHTKIEHDLICANPRSFITTLSVEADREKLAKMVNDFKWQDLQLFCRFCNSMWTSYDSLKRHELSHGEKVLKCTYQDCNYESQNRQDYNRHLKMAHTISEMECQACHFKSQTIKVFKSHLKTVHHITSFDYKPYSIINSSTKDYAQPTYESTEGDDEPENQLGKGIKCRVRVTSGYECYLDVKNRRMIELDESNRVNHTPYIQTSYIERKAVITDQWKHLSEAKKLKYKLQAEKINVELMKAFGKHVKPYKPCDIFTAIKNVELKKLFPNSSYSRRKKMIREQWNSLSETEKEHYKKLAAERNESANIKFGKPNALPEWKLASYESHLIKQEISVSIVSNRPQYTCKICNSTFPTVRQHNVHQKIHGPKVWKCGLVTCKQRFRKNNEKLAHERIVHGQYKYSCYFCGKLTRRYNCLVNHINSNHTKERPYLCTTCNKSFFYYQTLNRHCISKHLNIEPVKCKVVMCGYKHQLKSYHKRHDQYQHRPWRIKCHLCNKKFARISDLHVHIVDVHRNPLKVPMLQPELDPRPSSQPMKEDLKKLKHEFVRYRRNYKRRNRITRFCVYIVVAVEKEFSQLIGFNVYNYLHERQNKSCSVLTYIGKNKDRKLGPASYHSTTPGSSLYKLASTHDCFVIHFIECKDNRQMKKTEANLQVYTSLRFENNLKSGLTFKPAFKNIETGEFIKNNSSNDFLDICVTASSASRNLFCLQTDCTVDHSGSENRVGMFHINKANICKMKFILPIDEVD